MSADAAEAGARVIHAADSNAPDVLEAVSALAPDYVFVIGWSQICKPAFRQAAGGPVIGYHPAPLPRLRGRAVLPWTTLTLGSAMFRGRWVQAVEIWGVGGSI